MSTGPKSNIRLPVQTAFCEAKHGIEQLLFADLRELNAQQTADHFADRYAKLLPLTGAMLFALKVALQDRVTAGQMTGQEAIDLKDKVGAISEKLAKTSLDDTQSMELVLAEVSQIWRKLL